MEWTPVGLFHISKRRHTKKKVCNYQIWIISNSDKFAKKCKYKPNIKNYVWIKWIWNNFRVRKCSNKTASTQIIFFSKPSSSKAKKITALKIYQKGTFWPKILKIPATGKLLNILGSVHNTLVGGGLGKRGMVKEVLVACKGWVKKFLIDEKGGHKSLTKWLKVFWTYIPHFLNILYQRLLTKMAPFGVKFSKFFNTSGVTSSSDTP